MAKFIVSHHSTDNKEIFINVDYIKDFSKNDSGGTYIHLTEEDRIIVKETVKEICDMIISLR